MTLYSQPRDRGWAWLVLIAGILNHFVASIVYSIGIYINELIIEQNVSHSVAGTFGAVHLSLNYCGGLATLLTERLSGRIVLFAASLIASASIIASVFIWSFYALLFPFFIVPGICAGVIFTQSVIVVNQYFDKYHGIANGFTLTGGGLGVVVLPVIYDTIIEVYSWRKSLFIVAGIVLHGCTFAIVMKPMQLQTPDTQTHEYIGNKRNSVKHMIWRNPSLYLYLLSVIFHSMSSSFVYVLGPNLFYDRNISNWKIAMLLVTIGSGNMSFKIVLRFLLQIKCLNKIAVFIVFTFMKAISLSLFIANVDYATMVTACLLFGISEGGLIVTRAVLPRVIVDLKYYAIAFSLSQFCCAIGILGGPSFTGLIYDRTKSYVAVFLINSGMSVISGLILCPVLYLLRHNNQRTNQENIVSYPDQTLTTQFINY